MKLGKLLKDARANAGVTLEKAADYIGCSGVYLHELESNKANRPKIDYLRKAAEYYNISSDELIIAAEKVPQDVYWKIVRNPILLNTIRNLEI